ncbi:hypothetical protein JCM10450v2_006553 [Rhodotorula kratochvilovae]
MHESAQLLAWTDKLYSWFIERFTKVRLQRGKFARKASIETAWARVREAWPELLPFEREETVDILLTQFCSAFGTGQWEDDAILFAELSDRIGFYREDPGHSSGGANAAWDKISEVVASIADLYEHGPLHHDATRWGVGFLAKEGACFAKIARMAPEEKDILHRELEGALNNLKAIARRHEPLPVPDTYLPVADDAIARAQVAAQSAEDRFHIMSLLLENVPTLYKAPRVPRPGVTLSLIEQSAAADKVVGVLKGHRALAHFESLSVDQQLRVIHHARGQFVEACEQLVMYTSLPDPDSLNPLEVESLAHAAASSRQISDRKARRYYGTTARAWEARQAAGGL